MKHTQKPHIKKSKSQNGIPFFIKIAISCLLLFIIYAMYALATHHTKANAQFIKRNGQNLTLGNKNFRVVGVNDYDLAYRNNTYIAQTFAKLHNAGVTTVRFWLFGDGNTDGFQPSAGDINEIRFKQTDYILYEAAKYNMKVIPVLINNWTAYGGKNQYIEWIGENPATDETAFWTNNQITSLFKKYINYVLSRRNTYTNVLYANDPTILGWDIMNEPRSNDQVDMNNWLGAIAIYIKQRDHNHLVFAGTENATVSEPITPADVGKSSDLCANQAIDVCSVHLYLFNSANNEPIYNNYTDVANFIQEQENYARQVDKPLLLEEFGIAQNTKPFGENQLQVMKQIVTDAKQNGYAGYLIWDWSNTSNSPFTFSPKGDAQGKYSLSDLRQLLE